MARPTKDQAWRDAIGKSVTKLTPDVVTKLKEAFAIRATIEEACNYAEISTRSYYRWVEKNPILSHEFERMRQKLPLAAKANIAASIQTQKSVGDSWKLLEKTNPETYGETLTLRHQGDVGLTHEDDIKATESYHATLRENLKKRSMEKAKKEGEIPA